MTQSGKPFGFSAPSAVQFLHGCKSHTSAEGSMYELAAAPGPSDSMLIKVNLKGVHSWKVFGATMFHYIICQRKELSVPPLGKAQVVVI